MIARQSIPEFYKNKKILITGATGLVGVALVEKFLRSFPNVEKLYLIARNKNGQNVQERSAQYFENKIFQRVKLEVPHFESKIEWLEGDLSNHNLGLSHENLNVIKDNVNVMFHSAASVKFNEHLKDAIQWNVGATHDLLNIAQDCKQFQSFVYVSTAFSNVKKSIPLVEEKLYPSSMAPKKLLHLSQILHKNQLEAKTKTILCDWPNTYTFTKNAAENLVSEFSDKIPVGIFRPAVVVNALLEPFPYCILNCDFGIVNLLKNAKFGLKFQPHPTGNCNGVPVDLTVNAMIASAYAINKEKECNIYNFSTYSNPCSFANMYKYYMDAFQYEPESQLDEKSVERHKKFLDSIHYFIKLPISMDNRNVVNLWKSLTNEEQQFLNFSVDNIDWKPFYRNMYNEM